MQLAESMEARGFGGQVVVASPRRRQLHQVAILLKPENAKAATAFYHYNKGDRKDEALLAGLSDVDELKKLFSKKEKPQQKKRKAESDAVVEKEANAGSA